MSKTKKPVYTKGKTVQPLEAVNIPSARLRLETVVALTGMSKSTVYRWIAEGKFPAPLESDEGRSLWLAALVKEWLDGKATQQAGPASPPSAAAPQPARAEASAAA